MNPTEWKITVEITGEDRERIDRLIDALKSAHVSLEAKSERAAAPEQPAPVTEKAEEVKPAATLADVQALVQTLIAPGSSKREKTKEIVRRYADRVSAIPADKLGDVFAALTALKEGD